MEYIEKIKKMLCKELDEYAMKSKLSMADVDAIHTLTDSVKNLDKIEMLEDGNSYDGYSEMREYPYMGASSYARGRGRYAKRDSMGRYSSDDRMNDDYSEARMDRRYSRDDAKDHMMNKLGSMMEDADPNEREILKKCMRELERA